MIEILKNQIQTGGVNFSSVGKPELMPDYEPRSSTHPYIYFHEKDQIIDYNKSPEWAEFSRNKKWKYLDENNGDLITEFVVSNYSVNNNTLTINLANNSINEALMESMSEDFLKSKSSIVNWAMVANIPEGVGSLNSGDFQISFFSVLNKQLIGSFTNVNTSGNTPFVISIHPRRVIGSNNVRWRQKLGVPYSLGKGIFADAGHRDRMQGHFHANPSGSVYLNKDSGELTETGGQFGNNDDARMAQSPYTDGVNGTPRTGESTRASGFGELYAENMKQWIE